MVNVAASILVGREAEGPLLVLDEPLSLWGGVDAATGRIVETIHPQTGVVITDTILALSHGKGSSSASSVLAEMIRLATAPTGIIVGHRDPILVAGSIVAAELYGTSVPVALVDPRHWDMISTASRAAIGADGWIRLS